MFLYKTNQTELKVMNNTNESLTTTVSGGIRLILNGGKNIMEQATIPVQWFFSPNVINKRPTHVLIIEQSENEYGDASRGARMICKVTDRVAFVQLFSPGKHHFAVLALSEDAPKKYWLKENSVRDYDERFYFDSVAQAIEAGDFSLVKRGNNGIVGATIQEIEVPEELFAARSRSKIGEAVWTWVNLGYKKKTPRDQCEYRSRFLYAFTMKPFFYLIGKIASFFFKIAIIVLFPVIRIVIFFFGYKTNFIFKHTADIWKGGLSDLGNDPGDCFINEHVKGYKVWSIKDGKTHRMPVTGIEVAFLFIVGWGLKIASNHFNGVMMAICVVLVIMGLSALIAMQVKSIKVSDEVFIASERESYEQWLRNLAIDQAPIRVDLKHLPAAYRGSWVQKFRVGFWNAKMKVCRPYAK